MSGGDNIAPPQDEWMDRSGLFPMIRGYAEAVKLLNDPRLHADYNGLLDRVGATSGLAGVADRRGLLSLNGKEHKRLRFEIAAQFRPRAVDRVRPFTRELAAELLEKLPEESSFDFMQEFAKPFVERIIGEYIGLSVEELAAIDATLLQLGETIGDMPNRADEFRAAYIDLLDFTTELLRDRRGKPSDNVLGHLVKSVKSGAVDELFAINLLGTVLSAGLEPSTYQIGILIEELAKLPGVWDRITGDDLQINRTVEEMLRFRSTNPGAIRSLEEDVVIHDVCFTKSSNISVSISDANRDLRRYACPHSFDPDANSGSHLAFGFGPHYCLGAALVRLQQQEALRALTAQLRCPVVVEVEDNKGGGLRGPVRLEIQIQRKTTQA